MSDLLKKGFYTGLGAGLLLKDKIMDALNAPVRVNDSHAEELRHALDALSNNLEQGVDVAKEVGQEELDRILKRLGLVKAEDLEEMKARIAELEKKLQEREGKG
ncbi:phasin family protein [Fundidesulfovibrio putealis]|uniref:phasin family protein n=1 Tax=Fundidesulfovibrio putealis TaxID=270496 RepID=UPI0004015849|nr:hypothetical protein [Fundidesulfovibrio putealis]